jgi:hypothetical protein
MVGQVWRSMQPAWQSLEPAVILTAKPLASFARTTALADHVTQ